MANKGGYPQLIDCKICKKRVMPSVWKMHVMGKKHLHYTPKMITVVGHYPINQVDQVHQYFEEFGQIGSKKVSEVSGKIHIDYSFLDTRAHSKIIYKEHILFNQVFKVLWDEVTAPLEAPAFVKNDYKKPQPKRDNKAIDDSKNIIETIKDISDFNEEVSVFLEKLDSGKSDKSNSEIILKDLSSALNPMYALNQVQLFGSTVIGLDTRNSDLDVYIANVREEHKAEVSSLKLVRAMLFKSHAFDDVLLIGGAKCPIIKCVHKKTQIYCDINIHNKLAVCNSQLIRYYVNLDKKIHDLMMLVKFWANHFDLKKVNYFSSYSIYMMVIFYLQSCYSLLTVKELQEGISPDLVDGWNCAFEIKEYDNETFKNESLFMLLKNFFQFYSTFDYSNYVIAPYAGMAIERINFLRPYTLPQIYDNYVKQKINLVMNGGICIQDPFEHGRNVATSVPMQCVGFFIVLCKTSFEVMDTPSNNYLYKVLSTPRLHSYDFNIMKPESMLQFKETVVEFTKKILQDICHLTIVQKLNKDRTELICSGQYNVWEGRSSSQWKHFLSEAHLGDFELDIEASKCAIKHFNNQVNVKFVVEIKFPTENKAQFKFIPLKKCRIVLYAGHFFYLKFLKYFEQAPVLLTPVKMTLNDGDSGIAATDITASETSDNQTSTSKTGVENESDNQEEDVPADFFDDFANQDFMDGLELVDTWDEDKLGNEGSGEKEKDKHSPIRFINSNKEDRRSKKSPKSKSRSLTRRYRKSNSPDRRRSRSRDRTRLNERRDPEKTRRDINRDKLKVAKDREQKIVNDQLRIVETGLVPPGTEMEVDIDALMAQKQHERREIDDLERLERKKRREELKIKEDRERHKERERRVSRERRPRRDHESNTTRSRKRTSSKESNLSERELWIRSKRKRSRSRGRDSWKDDSSRSLRFGRNRSRSRSPRRSKSRKSDEIKKKRSFLEEIRDKLNATTVPIPDIPMFNLYPSTPVPVPAPGNMYATPQYDQNYFIGDGFHNQHMGFDMVAPTIEPHPIPISVPQPPSISPLNKLNQDVETKEDNERIDKLFADKKISLSDFLTMTAKCEVTTSSPEHIQRKIKVISRCQEVIKAMSEDPNFMGRLSVKNSVDPKPVNEVKYQSPLRKIPVVRFQFTTPTKTTDGSDPFSMALDRILHKIGLKKSVKEAAIGVDLRKDVRIEEPVKLRDCEMCLKRKGKTFADVGSQCNNVETVSVEIQVCEEDFSQSIAKKASIAYLTPAQLLGKSKDVETYSTSEKMPPTSPQSKFTSTGSFRGRGGFMKKRGGGAPQPAFYDYEQQEEMERFEARYGGPVRYQNNYMDQGYRENNSNFMDFSQPMRGRGRFQQQHRY